MIELNFKYSLNWLEKIAKTGFVRNKTIVRNKTKTIFDAPLIYFVFILRAYSLWTFFCWVYHFISINIKYYMDHKQSNLVDQKE